MAETAAQKKAREAAGTATPPDAPSPDETVDTPRGKVLNGNVHLLNPNTGQVELVEAGQEIPDWVTTDGDDAMVGPHLLSADATDPNDPAVILPVDGSKPPTVMSRPRLAAYASAHGVVVHAGATAEDILAALDAAGVATS